MKLEVGEVLNLKINNRDYIVLKDVVYDNANYYYLMSVDKPVDIKIVTLNMKDGKEVLETVTDKELVLEIMKLTKED